MIVLMDDDLQKVLAFMQANVLAGKLAPVAEELQKILSDMELLPARISHARPDQFFQGTCCA